MAAPITGPEINDGPPKRVPTLKAAPQPYNANIKILG